MGDFNIDCNPAVADSPNRSRSFKLADSLNLFQLVTDITHPPCSDDTISSGSTIDLVFSSSPHNFVSVETVPNPVTSDHLAVQFVTRLNTSPPHPSVVRQFLSYNPDSISHLNALLQYAPWDLVFDKDDINSSWEGVLDLINAAVKDAIPGSRKRTRKRNNSPWVDADLKHLCSVKRKLFSKAKRSGSLVDWNTYKLVRNQLKYCSRKAYKHFVDNMFSSKDNKKRFWSFVRSRKRSPTPLSFKHGAQTLVNPHEIACAFNTYFASVFFC
jgi:hypothetical protein